MSELEKNMMGYGTTKEDINRLYETSEPESGFKSFLKKTIMGIATAAIVAGSTLAYNSNADANSRDYSPKQTIENKIDGNDNSISNYPQLLEEIQNNKAICGNNHNYQIIEFVNSGGEEYIFLNGKQVSSVYGENSMEPGHREAIFYVTDTEGNASPFAHKDTAGKITPFAKSYCGSGGNILNIEPTKGYGEDFDAFKEIYQGVTTDLLSQPQPPSALEAVLKNVDIKGIQDIVFSNRNY